MKTSLPKPALALLSLGLLASPCSAAPHWYFEDVLMFEQGRLVLVSRGQVRPIDRPVTLSDGTVVGTDGYYMKTGGYRSPLGLGDTIAMDGIVMNRSTLPRVSRRR